MPYAMNYIDPGTGSMLFTLLIGTMTTGYFFVRKLAIKLRFLASAGGTKHEADEARLPYVIFSDDKRYWNVFKPVCDEFERRGISVAYWTASPDDPALLEPYEYVKCEFIGEENKAFARLNMMSADIVLATTPGLDVYQWKRSKDVAWYVHTFHTVGTALGYRMFGMDYFDAVLTAGEYQVDEIRTVEDARELPHKELVEVGSTYLDAMAERALNTPRPQNERTVVLLAPSWGPNAILSVYGERLIDAILDAGFELVIRPHPQSRTSDKEVLDRLMEAYPDGQRVSWNFDNDNFDVLDRADVMVTDFSGVIFDYVLVFDKPVIYTPANYDDALYDAAWYEKPQWRFEVYPSFGVPLDESDFPRFGEVVNEVIADRGLAAGRELARGQAWARPGEAAKLTVDYLVRKRIALAEQGKARAVITEAERASVREKGARQATPAKTTLTAAVVPAFAGQELGAQLASTAETLRAGVVTDPVTLADVAQHLGAVAEHLSIVAQHLSIVATELSAALPVADATPLAALEGAAGEKLPPSAEEQADELENEDVAVQDGDASAVEETIPTDEPSTADEATSEDGSEGEDSEPAEGDGLAQTEDVSEALAEDGPTTEEIASEEDSPSGDPEPVAADEPAREDEATEPVAEDEPPVDPEPEASADGKQSSDDGLSEAIEAEDVDPAAPQAES